MTIRELRNKRAALIAKARHLMDLCDQEKRNMTEDETQDYDQMMAEIESLGSDIEKREKLQTLEESVAANTPQDPDDINIGMSQRDLSNYRLVRAIRAAANQDWRGAELEREASEATAERMGFDPQGFFVPQDWLENRGVAERRDMVVGTDTAGGYLVDTDLQSQNFIGMLRNLMILRAAGARFLGGLVGDVAIPKQTGGATGYWIPESGAPTESQQTVGQIGLTPHTFGAFTDLSRKLLKQSSIDTEMFVRQDLATVLALGIDLAGLHGTGTNNQPTGVAATSGIGSVVGGANGAAPDWDDIIDLETAVAVDNADIGNLAYITNAKVRGKLKKSKHNATYGDAYLWPKDNKLNGYKTHVTNQVSSTLTKGSASEVCSAIFYGNWSDLIIGMWGGLDILVDPYTGGTSGTVRVVALQDVDVAVRHAESFAAMLDALTS
ncbi:MAG: phage major capsid protein [Anaerolineaceae bacterium]|nr:phage major capsid protein [Anaerolineaceae bacterium]